MSGTDGLALATRGLRKSYGSRRALDGLDLSVPTGVVYGFLGPNGAGKTTTMRVLTGLIHADGGSVEILGRPFKRGDRHRLFEVGALVESPTFYPYLSARANLRELAASGAPVPSKRIEELLDLVGLCDRANDKVQDYSMGMKQRLGIAAALLNDPKLLLLDEPANGLDPAGIVAMRDTLRTLASQGKTVLISSHLLAEIQVMADTVGIIASGKLVREGPLKELLSMQAVVKVRVQPNQVDAAVATLAPLFAAERLTETDREEGWLTVHIAPDRAEEVSQKLAGAGIYVSGMESGTDLEMLFLELTGGQAITGEGTFVGLGGTANGSATTGKETAE
ncbi:MAG TPA: ATP-binding cassette domain-containing protein [Candidatus Limnocylindrales bacterium]|nr:ATP-binding cassette domain-containing protein [Candidatus Limnocylindrales bacterium]